MDVLVLLKLKNRCLERFLEISNEFLKEIQNNEFSRMDTFQKRRDSVLKTIERFDKKLELTLKGVKPSDLNSLRDTFQEYDLKRKDLLQKIQKIDQQLIEKIQLESELTQKDLVQEVQSKSKLSKFKSSWISTSGTEVDQIL